MAKETVPNLQTGINQDIADNSTGQITAQDVRENLIDVTDSFLPLENTLNGVTGVTGSVEIYSSRFFKNTPTLNIKNNNVLTIPSFALSTFDNSPGLYIYGEGSNSKGVILYEGGDFAISSSNNISIIGPTSITGSTLITGSTGITGSTSISGSTEIVGSTSIIGSTEITGSTSISGSTTITPSAGFITFDLEDRPSNETSFSIQGTDGSTNAISFFYDSGIYQAQWVDFTGGNLLSTTVDAGNIQLTSDQQDYITLRNNGVASGLARENGLRFTRLQFESGTITNDSTITIPKDVTGTLALELEGYTVATLPAGTLGDRAYVTDAVSPTFLGTLTGGGSVKCPVFFNGTSWVSA